MTRMWYLVLFTLTASLSREGRSMEEEMRNLSDQIDSFMQALRAA